ncbi:hypothetical protein D1BOALGB6SA_5384 [Olavius sp. associated proteobacterium Delta 1]|nr:hypothetical protein D1BOALGB6SA_5384 [Olavius sp. associated proteobacterium Delta 1]
MSAPPLAKNNGQFNRKRNSEKANIENRIMNVEYRKNVFCRFYKKMTERSEPTLQHTRLKRVILRFCGSLLTSCSFIRGIRCKV